ncbi:immunity protein YezG family protein [Rossellomorea vietnamensis]|uniref:immunity protein YezG family protein n=1 Tax=Rossellomorea vietnamensis TaxID=218284 RepID=UPI001E3E33A5|nr:immunity protein YezG family protein [Rossellomorea vietnamensis]MCC5803754.1 DUF600 family protein [Rossellomorea vietnamensis]
MENLYKLCKYLRKVFKYNDQEAWYSFTMYLNSSRKFTLHGRIEKASGELTLEMGERNSKHQLAAGEEDRVKAPSTQGDHGGHLIGTQFNGSPLIDNIVAMNGNVNVSACEKLEFAWAKALKEGQQVSVDIKPIYEGESLRPSKFEIKHRIDGKKSVEVLENVYGGKNK